MELQLPPHTVGSRNTPICLINATETGVSSGTMDHLALLQTLPYLFRAHTPVGGL